MNDPRLLRALAPYGVDAPGTASADRDVESVRAVRTIIGRLDATGGITLLTGPSGAGKSLLLARVEERLRCVGVPVIRADRIKVARDRPVAGLARRVPLDAWLGCLSRAGLADARLFAARAGDLSEGETARLRLALAFARLGETGASAA